MITHSTLNISELSSHVRLKTSTSKISLIGKEARKMDRFCHYAIASADEAMTDSGLNEDTSLNKERMGIIWASGIGGLETFKMK